MRVFHLPTGYAYGVLLLVLVAVIWVGASHLIKAIFADLGFDRPFFLTYFNTCGFVLWLLGGWCNADWRGKLPEEVGGGGGSIHSEDAVCRQYLSHALMFAPLWMGANYTFHLSLTRASVASNSILSNTSSLWTMILSVLFFGETATANKMAAVVLTIGGATMVALADSEGAEESAAAAAAQSGNLLALLSAVCYAVYTVALRARVPDAVIMPVFFGYVGLVVLVTGVPFLLLFHLTDVEPFSLPSPYVLVFLSVNALIGTNVSDVLWARAVVLTSPVIATLALSLTIPFSMLSDSFLGGSTFSGLYISGSLLVLSGFVLANQGFVHVTDCCGPEASGSDAGSPVSVRVDGVSADGATDGEQDAHGGAESPLALQERG